MNLIFKVNIFSLRGEINAEAISETSAAGVDRSVCTKGYAACLKI